MKTEKNIITDNLVIKLKGTSLINRAAIKKIMFENYIKLLDEIEKEADYCSIFAYWKDYEPTSKKIIDAETFIDLYNNKKV